MGKLTLPAVTSKLPADLRNFIQRVRELISGAVSIDDLVNSGIATTDPSGNLVPTTGPQDFTTPPPPTGLSASGSITAITLEWDDPEDIGYTNNAYTEIWRSGTDNLSSAVKIGTADWIIYTDTVDPGSTYYYWIRFVSKANIVGPFNGTSGTLGVTNDDPAVVLAMLEAAITSTELHASLGSRIDLIDGSVSTPGTIPYQIAQVQSQIAQVQSQVDDLLAIPVYDNATAYIAGDTVKYNGGLYTAKQATTGNLPTNTTYWDKIGDYSSYGDALAALSSDVSTVTANLSAETTARTTLASQVRGSYTGTDIASVTTGLLYSEKTARTNADSALSSSISSLTAIVNSNAAAITDEKTARTNADSALSTTISSVQATANAKNKTYYQALAPTSGIVAGDLWIDSDDSNKPYRYSGTSWVSAADTRIATNAAAIVTEQTARANADSALASSITTVQATANAKNKTYYQALAPTSGIVAGDLWIDSDDSNKTYRYNGATWVLTADTRIATNTVAIQTEATTRASETGELYAQYTVKIDAGGKVSGYGLASTGPTGPGSVFEIRANKIAFAAPAGVTGTSIVPFAVDTLTGRVAMDAAYIKTATINTAQIKDLAVTDAKMVSLTVAKVTSGIFSGKYIELASGGNIRCGQTAFNTGTGFWLGEGTDGYARFSIGTPNGQGLDYDEKTGKLNFRGIMELKSGSTIGGISADYIGGWASSLDNTKIDGVNIHADSSILTGSTAPTAGGRYSVLSGGELQFFDYYSSSWHLYKSLQRTVTGLCADGETVNIGYFRNQPSVIITPFSLDCFNPTYINQAQKFVLSVGNLRKIGDDWFFDTVCQLQLAAGSVSGSGGSTASGTLINKASSIAEVPSFNPITVTTAEVTYFPPKVRQITATVRVKRELYVEYKNLYTTMTVTASVTLEIYANGAWTASTAQTVSNKPGTGSITDFTFNRSSLYDITKIRAKSTFSVSGTPTTIGTVGPEELIQTVTIINTVASLASAAISAKGKATWIAIG